MDKGFEQIGALVEKVGLDTALRLVAGWGGRTLYVPGSHDKQLVLISFFIGETGARKLYESCGGQTITIPSLDLKHYSVRADVIRLTQYAVPIGLTASLTGVTRERVKQILREYPGAVEECGNNTAALVRYISREFRLQGREA